MDHRVHKTRFAYFVLLICIVWGPELTFKADLAFFYQLLLLGLVKVSEV